MESYQHLHLMEEIIIEILSRLPVKSLLKFKSVCKNWYAIIKSPNFITKHLHNHCEENDNGLLLVQRIIPKYLLYGFELLTDKTLANLHPIVDPYMLNTAFAQRVLGPLNGLYLLFSRKDQLALWNPATREFKPLPSHPITDLFHEIQMNPPTLGLGFDPSTNDDKVIWFIYMGPNEQNIFLLYTLSDDSWRELKFDGSISNSFLEPSLCNANTYWNGYYYWIASSYNDVRGVYYQIYALDMVNEVISEIQGPSVPFTNITMYNGRIASFFSNDVNIDIWVMKSVGFWTKQLTIGPLPNLKELHGYWINGGILFTTQDDRLMLCNTNQELRDLGRRGFSQVYIHKESLVSLKSRNGKRKDDVSTNRVTPIRYFLNIYP